MTCDKDNNEDHDVAPVPEDDPKDNLEDDPKDDHEDAPKDDPQVMSTKKAPAVAKATSTKPAEVVISPPAKKLCCFTLIRALWQ